jgi:hypothetical protein
MNLDMLRDAPAAQRAALGAAWLDTVRPDWHTVVDPARLDIDSSTRCVIAQLGGGSYQVGIRQLDPGRMIDLTAHGFYSAYRRDVRRYDASNLEAAWEAEINRRRYGSARPPLRVRVMTALRRAFRFPN